jgi:hypothetical protein
VRSASAGYWPPSLRPGLVLPGQEAKTAATILDATIARKEFMTFSPDQNRWEIAREGARSNLLRVCPSKRRNSDHSARWFSTDKSALNAVNRVELTPRILRRLLILPYSTDAIQAFSCRFRFGKTCSNAKTYRTTVARSGTARSFCVRNDIRCRESISLARSLA